MTTTRDEISIRLSCARIRRDRARAALEQAPEASRAAFYYMRRYRAECTEIATLEEKLRRRQTHA